MSNFFKRGKRMKIIFYYSNDFCENIKREVVDFPDITDINNPKIDKHGEAGYQLYMESCIDDIFAGYINYPNRRNFNSESEYDNACLAAEEKYFENGEWWCKEYNDIEKSI